jgi:aryl-alcohol dehydrogenase-like predicted oxidoreductase
MVMEELALARERDLPAFVSEQPPYNLLDRRIENELIPLCLRYGVAVLPWSPLAGGVLAGRYDAVDAIPADSRAARLPQTRERVTTSGLDIALAVRGLADERGLTASQLALLWVKDQPGVTAPIIGPRTLEQLDDALSVLDLSLDEQTRVEFDALVHPGSAVVDFHNTAGWVKTRVR